MPYAFRYGPLPEGEGRTRFRLWAPSVDRVTLQIEGKDDRVMLRNEDGWHEGAAECGAGARYKFRIGDVSVPDPASRMQDQDVHDWSVVMDPSSYEWQHKGWSGRPWEETVLYELHPGLLGGFTGIQHRLERLAALGITAVELMPIADFPGERNWGYDGVLPFAPDRAYGTPDELKALIDTAHGLGLMVFLDVVYNHFGPDGNYLQLYAPQFFDKSKETPWGAAIDFRQTDVRRYFIENAIYWLTEFRFDGLRFDAVHAICDKTFLPELAQEARDAVGPARHIHLVVENDDNDSRLLRSGFDAQWDDDLHHVLHVLLTGEHQGYYEDYSRDAAAKLARCLSEGFVYQGDPSAFRDGESRGTSTSGLSPTAFVFFLQNHDQIGNRAFGERLTVLADAKTLEPAVALQLLAPQIPLIFTGEETGAREPFFYFTDHHDPKLAEAVRDGRRREFTKFPEFADEQKRAQVPDPNALETFQRSIPNLKANATTARYTELLQVRRQHLFARLRGVVSEGAQAIGPAAVIAHWRLGDGGRLTIACNLGKGAVTASFPDAEPLWGECSGGNLGPSTTVVWIEP
jgi:maltooligosyltrehalose trehalohydrolase